MLPFPIRVQDGVYHDRAKIHKIHKNNLKTQLVTSGIAWVDSTWGRTSIVHPLTCGPLAIPL